LEIEDVVDEAQEVLPISLDPLERFSDPGGHVAEMSSG
jgi:hypothetical protein